jgi:DNA-binding transcriptional regulator YiaG
MKPKASVTFTATEDGCVKSTPVETDTMRRLLLKQLNARYKGGIDPRTAAARKRPTEASIALGEDIKKARELYGMDTDEFGKTFKVSITRLKNLELGRANVSLYFLERVARMTGTQLKIELK